MTVADKLCIEARRAPRVPLRLGRRVRRAHDPSCFRRRRGRLGRKPQQQGGDAGGLCRERELVACNEIELARTAPDFQHHGTQRIAGERIRRRPQRALHVESAHRHQTARVEAELAKSAHRQRACFDFAKILPHPDQRPPRCQARCKANYKSSRNRAVPAGFREHLMHHRARETAIEHCIYLGMAERHPAGGACAPMSFDARDPAS
jgi:hypothetical protein